MRPTGSNGSFGITQFSLVKGHVQALGDSLSRVPQTVCDPPLVVNSLKTEVFPLPDNPQQTYAGENDFGPVHLALNGELPDNPTQRVRVEKLLQFFSLKDGLMYYEKKVCVLQKNIQEFLHLSHDSSTAGHFSAGKKMDRLSGFNWWHKVRDVEAICAGCTTCQRTGMVERSLSETLNP